MMMEFMIKLPDDIFRQELLQYLTVCDIVKLDNACMNYRFRPQLLAKISGAILIGDKENSIKTSLFKWLGIRQINLTNMLIAVVFYEVYATQSRIQNDYVDQFRYTQHVVLRGPIREELTIFIVSHCPCLLSIDIADEYAYFVIPNPHITDRILQSIAENCTRLQSLSLKKCSEITDTGIIFLSEHCPNLLSIKADYSGRITDASITSISTYCTGLHSLHLSNCLQITDVSIISISAHCTGLVSLHLSSCNKITDISIISISTYCIGLQSLDLDLCTQITDASIISISTHCTRLEYLKMSSCREITDVSIISISTHCTVLKLLNLFSCDKITDTSLITIAKNCTELQFLGAFRCDGLSHQLRCSYKSVFELQASLLSIYPLTPP